MPPPRCKSIKSWNKKTAVSSSYYSCVYHKKMQKYQLLAYGELLKLAWNTILEGGGLWFYWKDTENTIYGQTFFLTQGRIDL